MMNKFLFVYLYILSLALKVNEVKNVCSNGTLKCDLKLVEPILCDFKNGFVLNSNTKSCEQINIEGCLIYDFTGDSEGKCFLCDKEMVFDYNSSKCVGVVESRAVLNCFFYEYIGPNCIECAPDYFLKNNSCVSVGENKIENCRKYSHDVATCSDCEEGYALKSGVCEESNLIHNCLLHTNIFCDKCNEDYFPNFLKSSPISISSSFITNLILGKNNSPLINNHDNLHPVCLKNFISNCKVQQSEKKCEECSTGYMLKANGLCEEIPKETLNNCLTYSSFDQCLRCKDNYFVGTDHSCYERSLTSNCKEYNLDSDSCSLCQNGYYLDSASQECIQFDEDSSKFCKINDPYKNDCNVCEYGYIKSVFSTTFCVKDIANCSYTEMILENDETIPTVTCYNCDYGFYLKDNKCFSFQGTEFCTHYNYENSSCITCQDSYEVFEGKCVFNYNDEKCIDMVWNYCYQCINMYFVNYYDECQKITDYENCTKSDGYEDACTGCNVGYTLSEEGLCLEDPNGGSTENIGVEPEEEPETSLCNSDESDETHYSCDSCKYGGKLIYGDYWFKNKEFLESLNCMKVTSNGEGCQVCKPFHRFVGGHCSAVDPNSSDCKLFKGFDFVDGTSTPCDVCNFEIGFGKDDSTNSCKLRTDPSTYFNCSNYPIGDYRLSCNECKEDFSPLAANNIVCLQQDDFKKFAKSTTNNFDLDYQMIENCLIVDFNLTCHTCSAGYIPSNDKSSCVELSPNPSFQINPSFDSFLRITKSILPSSETIANCVKYSVINDHMLGCSQCASNYVGIVELQNSSSSSNLNLIESLNGSSPGPNTWNPFIKCEFNTNAVLLANGNAHVESTDCDIGVMHEGYVGYVCIRCVPGKIGTILEIEKDMNNNIFPESTLALGNCALENTNSLKTDYQGIGYEQRFRTSSLQFSNFVHYTNCSTNNTKLFYMFIIDSELKVNWVDKKLHDGSDLKEAYCWTPSESLSPSSVVANCEVYSLQSLTSLSVNPTNNSLEGRCIACSPGYKPTVTNDTIESCDPIDDCSFLSNWLNSCSSPTNNSWFAELQDSVVVTKYEQPVPLSTQIPNCILVDFETKSKCLMCGEGYSTNTSGTCSQITLENSHCTESSIGLTAFPKVDELTLQNKQIMGSYYSRYFSVSQSQLTSFTNSFCNSCEEGMIMVHLVHDDYPDLKICGKSHTDHSDAVAKNCKHFNFNQDVNTCNVCKEGFAKNLNNECVEFGTANCKVINQSSQCIECLDSYELNETGECVPLNCKVFETDTQTYSSYLDQGTCAICADNHIPITHHYEPTGKQVTYCSPNPDPDSDCLNYSYIPDRCLKCKDPNKVNFIYDDLTTASQISQACHENLRTQRFFHFMHLDYFAFDVSSSSYIGFIVPLVPDAQNRSYSELTNISSTAYWVDFCVTSHNVGHCLVDGNYDNPACSQCEHTYFLKTINNTCNPSSIANCKEPSHNDESCLACLSGFYTEDGLCKERVNSLNICNQENTHRDECESCFKGISFLSQDKLCAVYTATHCLEFVEDKDNCLSCVEGFHLKEDQNDPNNSTCIELASMNCKVYSKEFDRCAVCLPGYFLNSNVCQEHSVVNCELFHRESDNCVICQNGFYLSSDGNCLENTKDIYCRLYESNKEGCKICRDGYLLNKDTLVCHKNPTGISHCVQYNIDDSCKTCKSEFFLNEDKCEPVTNSIPSCKYYKSATECQECFSNFVIFNNLCKEIEVVGCKEYLSHIQCKNCKSGYYYDKETLQCSRITIEFCSEVNPLNVAICLQCSPPYILKSDHSGCVSPDTYIGNCEEYYDSSTCIKCKENYFLSLDGKSCLHNEQYLNHSNCSFGSQKQDLMCLKCKDGYYLASNNRCYQIPMKGCFSFDWNSNTCLLCYPGYYMDQFGLCNESL